LWGDLRRRNKRGRWGNTADLTGKGGQKKYGTEKGVAKILANN